MNVTRELIQTALSRYLNDPTVQTVTPLLGGHENASFRIDRDGGPALVLRFYQPHSRLGDRTHDDLMFELTLMDFFHQQGLPVPKLYRSKADTLYERIDHDDRSYPFILTHFVPGQMPRNLSTAEVTELARVTATMHTLIPQLDMPYHRNWPGSMVERARSYMDQFERREARPELVPGIIEAISELHALYRPLCDRLQLDQLPRGPIHGDIKADNVKFSAGRLQGVFDFDDARTTYLIEDIVQTIFIEFHDPSLSVLNDTGSHYHDYLTAYESVRPLSTDEWAALPTFAIARLVYDATRNYLGAVDGIERFASRLQGFVDRYHHLKPVLQQLARHGRVLGEAL